MNRRQGFTLIELLVVVAIIALLVSILLPALGRARDLAKTSVCMAQIRGCLSAFEVYAGEYQGLYPDLFTFSSQRMNAGEPFDKSWWTMMVYYDFLGSAEFIYCPGYKLEHRSDYFIAEMDEGGWANGAAWEGAYGHMGMNQGITWPVNYYEESPFHPEKYVKSLGDTGLLYDSIEYSPNGWDAPQQTFEEWKELCAGEYSDPPVDVTRAHQHIAQPLPGDEQKWNTISIRHGLAMNTGFFDMHVEKVDGATFWEMAWDEPGTIWDGRN